MRDSSEQSRRLSVFLCHSSGDKKAVRYLYQQLLADGLDPWLDEEKLLPGHDWHIEITNAVRKADTVIVCLLHSSVNKEGYIQKEIKFALDIADEKPEGTIFIIPLKLEECEVPNQLRRWHWVNLYEEKGYAKLLNALRLRGDTIGISITTGYRDHLPAVVNYTNIEFPWRKSSAEKVVRSARRAAREQKYTMAEGLFNQVLDKLPDYPAALSGLANVRFHQRSFQEGIDYANRAIRIDPNFPYAYYQRAICLKAIGNLTDAESDLERALELKPDFEYAMQVLKKVRMLKVTGI